MQIFTAPINHYLDLSNDILQVFLNINHLNFHYHAGQYIEFLLPNENPRPYSIANKPDQNHLLEFHIRHEKNNLYSKKLIHYIKNNPSINLIGPFGKLQYHTKPKYPLLFIAAGTGFAPCKAIIEEALQDAHHSPIEIYWTARNKKDLYFNQPLLQLVNSHHDFSYYPIINIKNKLFPLILKQHQNNLSQTHIYISGPEEMVFSAQKLLDFPTYFYSDWLDYQPRNL